MSLRTSDTFNWNAPQKGIFRDAHIEGHGQSQPKINRVFMAPPSPNPSVIWRASVQCCERATCWRRPTRREFLTLGITLRQKCWPCFNLENMVENIEVLSGQTKIEHILTENDPVTNDLSWFTTIFSRLSTAPDWLLRWCAVATSAPGERSFRQPAAATAGRATAVAPPHLGNKGLQILFGFFVVFLWFFLFFSLGHFSLLFATFWSKNLYFAEFGN